MRQLITGRYIPVPLVPPPSKSPALCVSSQSAGRAPWVYPAQKPTPVGTGVTGATKFLHFRVLRFVLTVILTWPGSPPELTLDVQYSSANAPSPCPNSCARTCQPIPNGTI